MRRYIILIALLTAAFFTSAAHGAGEQKIGVVTSIEPMAYFIERIGGDKAAIQVMVPPGGNPHTYEPLPSQLVDLSKAGLYVEVGSGIEFELQWMDKLAALNKKMSVLNASEGIELIDMEEHHHDDAHEEGHREEVKDPHVWLSPANAVIMAKNVSDAFIKIDPSNKDFYSKNAEELVKELNSLKDDIDKELKPLKERAFLVCHPSWGYFARDFGLMQIVAKYSSKDLTPREIMDIVKEANDRNIKVVFASPQFSKKDAETIAKEIKGTVVIVDPLSRDYINNLKKAAKAFLEGMK